MAAQASFVAALMFYLGAMYTTSFFGCFNLTLQTVNLGRRDRSGGGRHPVVPLRRTIR
ncbi:hypothetical protein [Streptomyces sp. NPDC058086]|uniref:hypothetical protein n=1 Tax=Streptomyces sp. NPDC058086 TaxID=3346334 RepID=UPI0036E8AD91